MSENVIPFPTRPQQPGEPILTAPPIDQRQRVLVALAASKEHGVTWREVGGDHGSISAILSTFHKSEMVERLAEERDDCKVYVLPEYVQDRETERPRKTATIRLLDDMATVLREVPTRCQHRFWNPNCRSCEIRLVLSRYDDR